MDWKDVGRWLRDNAGAGTALVGSLLTGNVPFRGDEEMSVTVDPSIKVHPYLELGTYEVMDGYGALVSHNDDGREYCLMALEPGRQYRIVDFNGQPSAALCEVSP